MNQDAKNEQARRWAEEVLEMADDYAEARHTKGDRSYNYETAAKREAIAAARVKLTQGKEEVYANAKFFNYGVDSGFDTHETAEQARTAAENDLQCYRDEAGEGWAEEAERVCWGVILSETVEVDLGPAPEGSGFDKWIDYQLTTHSPAQPAREWVGLTEREIEDVWDFTPDYLRDMPQEEDRLKRIAFASGLFVKWCEKNAGQPVVKEN